MGPQYWCSHCITCALRVPICWCSVLSFVCHCSLACTSVTDALNRIRWRAHFKRSENSCKPRHSRFDKRVKPFTFVAPPEIEHFCHRLRTCISASVTEALSETRGKPRNWGNILPIDKLAHEWLCRSKCTKVLNTVEGWGLVVVIFIF